MRQSLYFAFGLLLFSTIARVLGCDAAQVHCAINTGLDPACPLTSIGLSTSTTPLSDTAISQSDAVFGSVAWHDNQQLTISFPFFNHLNVASEGDAYGTGDVRVGYTRTFGENNRLLQVAGLSVAAPTGAMAFTNARTRLIPSYALSYRLNPRVSLVTIAQYGFDVGGTKAPFAPRTTEFSIIPRAIVGLTRTGLYSAFDAQGSSITGDERYQAYKADAIVGIVRGHYNLSVAYAVPISQFTREHVFYRGFSAQLSLQR